MIDALDECDPRTRERLINILDNVLEESANLVKILISSRPDLDLKRQYQDRSHNEIQAINNRNDIARFVAAAIDSKKGRHYEVFKELREEIAEVILEKSQGM